MTVTLKRKRRWIWRGRKLKRSDEEGAELQGVAPSVLGAERLLAVLRLDIYEVVAWGRQGDGLSHQTRCHRCILFYFSSAAPKITCFVHRKLIYFVKERTRLLGVDQVIKCLLSLVLLGRRELLLFEIVKHLHEQLCVCLLRPRLLHTGQSARHAQHTQVPKQAYKTAWLGKVEPPTCSPTTSSIDCGSIAFAAAAASQNAPSARAWYSMLRWQ